MRPKISIATVLLTIALITTGAYAQDDAPANVQVRVDGNPVSFTAPLLMVDMQLPLLPADAFLAALGATSDWNAAAQRLDVRRDGSQLQMWVGRPWVTLDGARRDTQFGLQTFSEVPYVPGPETAQLLGLDVQWDHATLTLSISTPTVMPEGPTIAATLLEVTEGDAPSLLVRVDDTGQVGEVPLAADVVIHRGQAGGETTTAPLTDLQSGDQLEIVFDDTSTGIGVIARYAQTLGTIASIQGNELALDDGRAFRLGEGVRAVGSDGATLHLLAAVGQGAILTLNPGSNAVWHILAQRRGTTTPPPTLVPTLAAFTLPLYDLPLAEGAELQIRIVGSAGTNATVQFGATGPTVNIPEDAPGVYAGVMTIPAGMLLADEHLVARLQLGAAASSQVQSNRTVTIDAQPPVLETPVPQDQSTIAHANTTVSIGFHDGEGVGVDLETAALTLDGIDVTAHATVEASRIVYAPAGALAAGQHTASASIADELGNTASHTWSWTIEAPDRGILAVSHDAEAALAPGDGLTVSIEVDAPGQAARFSINGVVDDVPMTQVDGTNTYRGTYTVAQGDTAGAATVIARFTAADGTQYEASAPVQLTITAPDVPFAITTPAEGEQTGRRIRPAGTAPPGSTVRWTISYQEFILTGDIASATVTADDAGNWQAADQVDLRLLLIGMADRYTLTVELLDAAGVVQQTRSIEFRAR
ncbi:MAG: stalk domain-containing protein [Armatimonadota bacterium]|jgi:hypothetical protein